MEPLLSRLDKQGYDMIMANSNHMNVSKNNFIFNEGSRADHLFFIHTGEVRVFKIIEPKKDLTMFTRGEQDAFGEIGIFSGKYYSNSAQALQDCTVSAIERDTIEYILSENGMMSLQFMRWLAESLETSKAKIRDYIAFGSEGAIASVFVRYSNMFGVVTPHGIRITEPVMLQDVSRHVGVSRETVSRIVNKWKEKGIIMNDNKYYFLRDMTYFKQLLVCETCGVENCVL